MAIFKSKKQAAADPGESVIQEYAAELSRLPSDYSPSTLDSMLMGSEQDAEADALGMADVPVKLPLLGARTVGMHQKILSALLAISLLALAAMVYWTVSQADKTATQISAVEQALMESQRLAKSVSQAMLGDAKAFAEVKESAQEMVSGVRGLKGGSANIPALGGAYSADLDAAIPLVEQAAQGANVVLTQQKILVGFTAALRQVSQQTAGMLGVAEEVLAHKLQQGAPANEISAASAQVMRTQRIGKSASELLTASGVNPAALDLLNKDLNAFREVAQGLLDGSATLRLAPARDEQTRERLGIMIRQHEATRVQAAGMVGGLDGLLAARDAQTRILADSEPLKEKLRALQQHLSANTGFHLGRLLALLLPAALTLLAVLGLSRLQLVESRQRQKIAEHQRHTAEMQQQESKRVNDANQAAILRLMNELQTVAEGDLTQEATVTEDITGAIADSVNYTVEELRSLVGNVQTTVTRVAQTTSKVEATSAQLLAASTQQLHEIRETGQSVLDMASRINEVSAQAQESASVARQSLQAAESGLAAVQNTIGGMNAIRDQIQETSKRIKRLGESSQEIGEITELIADITEQTNVLALNAAIQAASAGEAGRGFSVVAEEVQRLAERSGDATRQIAALVKAIQTDTQDAVAAMERSTQGVVEGARLSDNAGSALSEIDRVSRRLAELIEQISGSALKEASQANDVANNIQHIFAVTEQAGESTRTTATQVRDLARMADELRQSVSRFKIA